MLKAELEAKKQQLETEVADLTSQVEPLMKQLDEKRETLTLVTRLLAYEAGDPHEVESKFRGLHSWADICREQGWTVGADSAHRVVMRQDPSLHASIRHECSYDGRSY